MRVLCLGNNTEATDQRTRELATDVCYGLLSELDGPLPKLANTGWYHSSIYDVEYGRLLELAKQFDRVIMLDQPKEEYSHPNAFYRTVQLVKNISNGEFLDPSYQEQIGFFENLVKTNKSFCIFPFIEVMSNNGNTTLCCRSQTPITKLTDLVNFNTDSAYQTVRKKMIAGELLPDHCSLCYQHEAKGMISARQQETVEWANKLNLGSLEDLNLISSPAYYEVRPSNTCNLQCRMCMPYDSHLIAKEYKQLKLIQEIPKREYSNFDFIDFTNLKKLYVAGGEPTAMPEFYEFLDRCIQQQKTDFELVINTNATKINRRLRQQLTHFPNAQFIVSLDGYQGLNHYIRWPSDWDTIIDNVRYLNNNHKIFFNTTVSIYNVSQLNNLFTFLDQEFPNVLIHCQTVASPLERLSAFNFPDAQSVVNNLRPIQKLLCYQNDQLFSSFIDAIIKHYETNYQVDLNRLQAFFEFNDKLDGSRNIKLVDYIPILEQARNLL